MDRLVKEAFLNAMMYLQSLYPSLNWSVETKKVVYENVQHFSEDDLFEGINNLTRSENQDYPPTPTKLIQLVRDAAKKNGTNILQLTARSDKDSDLPKMTLKEYVKTHGFDKFSDLVKANVEGTYNHLAVHESRSSMEYERLLLKVRAEAAANKDVEDPDSEVGDIFG